jgi:hypothetical protein
MLAGSASFVLSSSGFNVSAARINSAVCETRAGELRFEQSFHMRRTRSAALPITEQSDAQPINGSSLVSLVRFCSRLHAVINLVSMQSSGPNVVSRAITSMYIHVFAKKLNRRVRFKDISVFSNT